MLLNTSGSYNTALGSSSLQSNGSGTYNTAIGLNALYSNTSGDQNTSIGVGSLQSNTTASENVAIGNNALYEMSFTNGGNDYAPGCVAIGVDALRKNNPTGLINNGNWNVAVGRVALYENTIGAANVAVGGAAGNTNINGDFNVFIGHDADCNAGTYDNGTAVGYSSTVTASNQVRIGNGAVLSIGGFTNWTNISDARFKTDIRENVPGLDFILKLRPVTYKLDILGINEFIGIKQTEETMPIPQYAIDQVRTGFLAQDVEQAALQSGFDFDGVDKPKNSRDLYGLKYAEFTVPIVKAIQEQQTKIENLELQIQGYQERILVLENQIIKMEELKADVESLKKEIKEH
jgi:hypothetical protein